MKIKEIQSKSCLNKSKLTDYVINPYTGCQHECKYCYADFIKRFQKIEEEWGEFIFPKVNCPELLGEEIKKAKPGHIWLSSVTDPYTPIEKEYKLTRKILKTLLKEKEKFSVEILTKSSLVERDLDLIKNLNADLGMSIGSLNRKYSKATEPFSSQPEDRIRTLKKAKEKGIKVFGFISPVTIFTDLEEIFNKLSFCDYVWVEILNIKPLVKRKILPTIKKNFPGRFKEFLEMINNYDSFCKKIKEETKVLEKKYNLKVKDVVVH